MEKYLIKNNSFFSFSKKIEAKNPKHLLRKYIDKNGINKIKNLRFKKTGDKKFENLFKISSNEISGEGLYELTPKEYLTIFARILKSASWNNIDWNKDKDYPYNRISKLEPIVKREPLEKFLTGLEPHIPKSLISMLVYTYKPIVEANSLHFLSYSSDDFLGKFILEKEGDYNAGGTEEKTILVIFKHHNNSLSAAKYYSSLTNTDWR